MESAEIKDSCEMSERIERMMADRAVSASVLRPGHGQCGGERLARTVRWVGRRCSPLLSVSVRAVSLRERAGSIDEPWLHCVEESSRAPVTCVRD